MREYPNYITAEVVRRIAVHAMPGHEELIKFNPARAPDLALADLLIESGFKPTVGPLFKEVWNIADDILTEGHTADDGFEIFCRQLELHGLTLTVTKTGEA